MIGVNCVRKSGFAWFVNDAGCDSGSPGCPVLSTETSLAAIAPGTGATTI